MDNAKLVHDITLLLLYLTSWQEKVGSLDSVTRSWRSYDWDALDALRDEGFVSGSYKAKSVYLSEEGMSEAKKLLQRFEGALTKTNDPKEQEHVQVNSSAFKFRIDLQFQVLRCWREVVVPADCTFSDFHLIIQNAFNWFDYHLFDFQLKHNGEKVRITDLSRNTVDAMRGDFWGGDSLKEIDASTILLNDVFPRTRTALYSYDYGDGWRHKIKLMESVEVNDENLPVCTAGEGDAPPEDVGGEGGFVEFLRVIADKNDPEHDEMSEWAQGQCFERFNIASNNEKLSA
jgi:hypothetical protein